MAETKDEGEKAESGAGNSLPTASDQEREMAQQSTSDFEKHNYDACLCTLNKLAHSRGHDPKVQHNIAVVEYYKSGFRKTEEFKHALKEVCSKSRINIENLNALDDADQCVLFYNHALILYHLRQYRASLCILDRVVQFIEPMDETLSRKVMFLLVELYLCTSQPEKALGMVSFIEKNLFGASKSPPVVEKDGKDTPVETARTNSPNEVWRPAVWQMKAQCYLMLKSLKNCKRELKFLMSSRVANSCPVVYLKANLEFLRGNYQKSLKLLNAQPQPLRGVVESGQSVPAMYYNNLAVLHFHMRKHHLAAYYLRRAIQENAAATHGLGKVEAGKLSGRPLQTLSVSRHYELRYNIGVQLLHCGRPTAAFDCILNTVHLYQVNPRLWLRLAECCIIAHKESNDEDRRLNKRLKVIQGAVGSGVHRKVILGSSVMEKQNSFESAAIPVLSLEFACLCLRNALTLLPSDPVNTSPAPTTSTDTDPRLQLYEGMIIAAPPGNPLRGVEVLNLRCSILAASAYVCLSLNDHLVALQHADQLLKQPRLSGAHRYLGHMYIAEAMVALDRIADAVSHLNPEQVTDVATLCPESRTEFDKGEKNGDKDFGEGAETIKGSVLQWSPRDVPRARAIMQYNLATAHAVRGEYEKALSHLSKSTQTIGLPLPAQMYFLKLYLELMEGRRKTAQNIIKEHFGHVTPNRM